MCEYLRSDRLGADLQYAFKPGKRGYSTYNDQITIEIGSMKTLDFNSCYFYSSLLIFFPEHDWSTAIGSFLHALPFVPQQCIWWTIGMEPYTCCQAPDSCSSSATNGSDPASISQSVHHARKHLLAQLHESALHRHVQIALRSTATTHTALHWRNTVTDAVNDAERLDFTTVFLHVVVMMAECRAITLPRQFHVDLSSLGPELRSELDALQKQLTNILRRPS